MDDHGQGPDRPGASAVGDEADGRQRIAEFHGRLAELTPRVVVTPVLLALNVAFFGLMVARGVSPLAPRSDVLIAWGGNFAPLTLGGQWWRLLSSMFIHIGFVHLLMNMWVLLDAGRLLERMLGPAAFAVAYLLAGLAGSCASALWSPYVVSAGASGAIFGLFGVLGAFLLRQRSSLPPQALSALARSAIVFVGFNVLYGLRQTGIDMAAHLGGLVGGFVAGWFLVHEITPAARALSRRRTALVLGVGLVVVAAFCVAAPALLRWQE